MDPEFVPHFLGRILGARQVISEYSHHRLSLLLVATISTELVHPAVLCIFKTA
jgi:hypothetical protein